MITLRGGYETKDRRLDCLPQWDERNLNFPVRAALPRAMPTRGRGWSVATWLDQGQEGACVGFAWSHELAAYPRRVKVTNGSARYVYLEAQKIDEWAGEEYSGTSVLAGAQIIQGQGHIGEYRWAYTIEDIVKAIVYEGPVVMGTRWHEGMYRPDATGFLHPTGEVVGGHAYLLSSVSVAKRYFTVWNSWGDDWGDKGRAKISWDDMATLLEGWSDACVPMRRR